MSIKTLDVDIHTEFFDDVTKVVLRDCHETHVKEIMDISNMAEIPDHKVEDLAYSVKITSALKIVLDYFGEEV